MLKFGSKSDINVSYKCTVRLLEDTEVIECEFQSHHKGKYLLEYVCRQLNLIEKDYFGLRYVDHTRQRHWLDPAKTVVKQVKDMEPILFSFRVKFYPPDPFRLKEEITRYQIYLQLKRDLLHGRLYCTPAEAALLAAYIIQSELGDYDPEEHEENYVSEFKLLLKQTPEIEEKMMEIHQTQLKGQTPAQVENNFLRKACQLDTYGVDPHPVKDHRGNQLYLGINHCGILTFQGSRKTHHFRWAEVQKINYEGKMFIVHLTYNEDPRTKKKHTVGFKCPTGAACRHVWRCAIEQMLFFTLPSSSEAPTVVTGGSFFSWGTKFRYSGRVEREILEDIGPLRREEPAINRSFRSSSLRRKASSVPATPSTPVGSELGYGSLPRANHSAPVSDSRLDGGLLVEAPLSSPYIPDNTLPLLETVSEDQEMCNKHRAPSAATAATPSAAGEVIEDFLRHERGEHDVTATASEPIAQTEPVLMHHLVNGGGGKEGEGGHGFDDYYFRDSFEHSSSESQLVELSGGLGAKLTSQPIARPSPGSKPAPLPAPPAPVPVTAAATPKRFNLLQVFVPSFLCVALSLALATVLVLESDCEVLGTLRRWPEMVVLRRDYYEPAKEFLRQKLAKLLS
ncbi:FERM domain-containing protein 5 isoform X3 [Periplaneta americana]|uniref:FERM domain-containing protein 5 isoform X3 n=1 Tax=Periplaneta americana TaxID=6978 RepID=UPI0037E840DB